MRQPPTNICLLRGSPCLEDRCAWFHINVDPEDGTATGACALVSIADVAAERKEDADGR